MIDEQLDAEVRAAAFAYVRELQGRYAERIPRADLRVGVVVRGQRVPIGDFYRGIHKPAILGRDGAALSIQTSAGAPYNDIRDASSGELTYKYRGTDPRHPDNAALRRAMVLRRPLIYFEAVDPGVYDAVMPVYVVADDDRHLQFKLVADLAASIGDLQSDPRTSVRREYATRAVMERLHRHHFRRVVLRAYRYECCMCRLPFLELLDAAHILGDKHPRGEPSVDNGLALCRIHHAAFDTQLIGIDPDARVHVRPDVLRRKDGPLLRVGLQEMNGAMLRLPRDRAAHPRREFLSERYAQFLAGA